MSTKKAETFKRFSLLSYVSAFMNSSDGVTTHFPEDASIESSVRRVFTFLHRFSAGWAVEIMTPMPTTEALNSAIMSTMP